MSTLETRIAEVLAAHRYDPEGSVCTCSNEVQVGLRCDSQTHAQHVAAVLAPVIREAQADLVDALADELGSIQHGAEIAEVAAHVPGEVGRQACIDAWESILEEPDEWLREKARQHRGNERDHLQELLFDAWQAGHEDAQQDMKRPANVQAGHLIAMTSNPYRSNDDHR